MLCTVRELGGPPAAVAYRQPPVLSGRSPRGSEGLGLLRRHGVVGSNPVQFYSELYSDARDALSCSDTGKRYQLTTPTLCMSYAKVPN